MELGFIWAASACCLAQDRLPEWVPAHPLCIHLYNLANVPADVLDGATKEAARILTRTGIQTVWHEGPAAANEAHIVDYTVHTEPWHPRADIRSYLVVNIDRSWPYSPFPCALGFALPDARSGVHAVIFYDRIQELLPPGVISLPKMLALVMAHEIGHVLLGSLQHSSAGIMKAVWDRTDFQYDPAGRMEFTLEQRRIIRERAPMRLSRQPE
jgi:hypothetical protein